MSKSYVGITCPYCQFPIKQHSDIVICVDCKIPHHKDCWNENTQCTTFGCDSKKYSLIENGEVAFSENSHQNKKINLETEDIHGVEDHSNEGSFDDNKNETTTGILSFFGVIIGALLFLLNDVDYGIIILAPLFTLFLAIIGLFQVRCKRNFAIFGLMGSLILIIFAGLSMADTTDDRAIQDNGNIKVPDDYNNIQSAIDNASNGDIIVVSEGVYEETIDFKGKDIILRSKDPESPEVVANTVIKGDGEGSVVTFENGESNNSYLAGLTITGGIGTQDSYQITSYGGSQLEFERQYGGGIYITGNSDPTITNNIIVENKVEDVTSDVLGAGGGIAILDNSSPIIKNNAIINNYSDTFAGGILVWYRSNPQITANLIENNSASDIGGGIMVAMMCSTDIKDNQIIENYSGNWGGGIYVAHMSDAKISRNKIASNHAYMGAGIFARQNENVIITENKINNNKADADGGGIHVNEGAMATIEKNIFQGNIASNKGGAIWVDDDSSIVLSSPDNNSYENNTPDRIYKKE